MAINPEIRDQAFRFFVQEAPDLLCLMETELLQLRLDRNTPRVHALMRAAHSIKGGAANVGLEAIKYLSHRLEDYFRAFYNDQLELDDELESMLLEAYDRLRIPLLEAIQLGDAFDGETAIAAAEPIFSRIEARLGDFLGGEDCLPTVAEMGIDITQVIFETDVSQQLARLESLKLDDPLLAGELRAVADVLLGIAELLNLAGLMEIVQLTMTALDTNPQASPQILQAALSDFQAAQRNVLAGDRSGGGSASETLRSLAQAKAGILNQPESLWQAQLNGPAADSGTEPIWADREAVSAFTDGFGLLQENLETPTLGDIFVQPAIVGEAPTLADIFAQPLVSDDVPGLDDIFSRPETTQTPALADMFVQPTDNEVPALADIFSSPETMFQPPALAERLTQPASDSLWEPLHRDAAVRSSDPEVEAVRELLPMTQEETLLAGALSAIAQDFDQLPGVDNLTEAVTPLNPITEETKTVLNPVKATAPQPTTPTSELSVRLDLAQLERMNNQLGELSINRSSLSLQNEQLQESLQSLRQRFNLFLTIGTQLRGQLNKMLISPDRYARPLMPLSPVLFPGNKGLSNYGNEFDALELDSYNEISNLMQEAMECVLQLEESVGDVTLFAERSDRDLEQQRRLLTGLRDELMWARMLPLGGILNHLPRQLRDLSLQYKKPVDLQLSGTGVLVDKAVLEKLYDPLLHLVRNAFDHGIEEPSLRQQQGKPERGQIQIHAYHTGSRTLIEIRDDGRGINLERIRDKAVAMGLLSPESARTASNSRLLDLLFEPGFSTAEQVSELSGRGVGLDIVRAQLQALKGSVSVTSELGRGTTFTLRIPLTLSISKLMLLWSGTSALALPSDSIEDVINPQPQMLKQSNGQRFLFWREQVIPIYSLEHLLPYNCPLPEGLGKLAVNVVPTPEDWAAPLLVLRQGSQYVALEVERLLSEQELVIKPFSPTLAAPGYLYGCTILADGSLVPVLDGITLLSRFQQHGESQLSLPQVPNPPRLLSNLPTILIVDDSAGMRQTLSLTLDKAGYRVLQARDGREALEQLQQNSQVKLVICDVEMPIMNGFEFLTQRRQHPSLIKIPVVMLTSRSGDKHRRLALHLGADAYVTKPYIEQQFLSQVRDLLQLSVAAP